jgi:signal transduction histidine kinase
MGRRYDIITEEHGGTIAIDSEPGQFTITLPRRSA